jgi:hypothetical protein
MHDEYAPYDPAETLALRATDADDAPEQPPAPDDLPEFDPHYRDPFYGLIYIGALSRDFDLFGHRIKIRTLKQNEILMIGEITKPYLATLSEAKAYTQAVVSMALVTVDGRELPTLPLGDGSQLATWAQARFGWVGEQYHDTVVAAIYNYYLVLADTVSQVIEAMGKASGQPQ